MKKALSYILLTLFLIMVLFPFIWMLLTALKPQAEALTISIIPKHVTFKNFIDVVVQYNFMRYSLNSFIVAIASAVASTVFAAMAAYAFAKKNFRFRNTLFAIFLSSMMVPGLLYVVPQFAIVYRIGWVNTYLGMIVPHLANVFGMFMLTQFMKGIPDSLLEAAKMDGAGDFRIFVSIMVPLTAPAIATVFLLNFQFHWNNFLWQLLIAQDESLYTVPVGLAMFKSAHEEAYALKMAASTIAITPIALIFLLAQRYFIEGMTKGALKG